MIMVREPGDPAPNTVEYRHGLTPPMKDARKRRFRREPDLNVNLHLLTTCCVVTRWIGLDMLKCQNVNVCSRSLYSALRGIC